MQEKRAKVLIIEDEAIIGLVLEQTLAKAGYEVLGVFAQGEQCIEYLGTEELPDVIIMDIQLDGELDGIETAAIIRERWNCPVVYLTAYSSPELIERIKRSEPFGYLLKPFNEKDLCHTLEISIHRAELERQVLASERRFKGLANSLQQIIFQTDLYGNIIYLNNVGQDQLNITSAQFGTVSLFELCFPGAPIPAMNYISEPVSFQSFFKQDVRISGISQRPYFYDVQVSPEYDNGKLVGYSGVMVNTTKVRMQLELQKSFKDLSALLHQGKIGTDELKYYLLKLLKSLTAVDAVYFNTYDAVENRMVTYRAGEEQPVIRKNGRGLSEYVISSGTPLFLSGRNIELFHRQNDLQVYGEPARSWIGVPVNISSTIMGVLALQSFTSEDFFRDTDFEVMKDVGRELSFILQGAYLTRIAEETEMRYKNLVDSISEGILQVDLVGETVMFANTRFNELLGLEGGTIAAGLPLKEFYAMQTDADLLKSIFELRRQGRDSVFESSFRTPDGQEKWFRVSGRSFIGKSGTYDTALSVWTDITERKLAEESIRASEARLREVVTTIEEVFWLAEWNTNRILYYSPSFEKVFGAVPRENDSIQQFRNSVLVPGDQERLNAMDAEGHMDCPYDIQYRITDAGGKTKWIQERAFPVYNESGVIIKIAGTSIDISDRKEAENLLLQSEQNLRAIFNSVPDSLVVVDDKGIITDCIFKRTVEAELRGGSHYQGQQFKLILGPEFADTLEKFLADAGTDGMAKKLEYNSPGGAGEIWLEFRLSKIQDERILVLIRDVTNETLKERDLLRFYNIIEQSEELILVTDAEGRIMYTNPRFTEITGFEAAELYGLTPSVVNSGKHTRKFFSHLWKTIKSGQSFHGEFTNRKKNGELFYEEKIISPVFDAQGTLINFIATGRDITEKKNTEQRLDAYRKLQDYQLKRQQRLKSLLLFQGQEEERTRLSRDLHDGIGQILTAIKINLESVDTDAIGKKASDRLYVSHELIAEAIQEVRRVSSDLSPSGLHDFGLHAAVKGLVVRLENTMENCSIRFNSRIADFRYKANVEIGVYRIIQEALNNAVRHSKATRIDLDLVYNDGMLIASVSDNGVGFVEDHAQSALFQVPRGKGLNNMKERANIIGGELSVVSKMNAGVLISFQVKTKINKHA